MSIPTGIHPAAAIFPMMEGDAFERLKCDIADHGQQEAIVYWKGQLVDGRNRLKACQELKIEPSECELDESTDPVAYVLSANLHRRHLTASQLSLIGAKVSELYEAAAKKRQVRKPADSVVETLPQQKGRSRDMAGAAVGVSGKMVDAAKRVVKSGDAKLIKAVETGKLSVHKAADLAAPPKPKRDPKRHRDSQRDPPTTAGVRKQIPEMVAAFRRSTCKADDLRTLFECLEPHHKVLLREWLMTEGQQ